MNRTPSPQRWSTVRLLTKTLKEIYYVVQPY